MKINVFKRKVKTVLLDPKSLLIKVLYKISPLFDDVLYLKCLFPLKVGYQLNLDSPETYNEKMQWLKLNLRHPLLTRMADKYQSKLIVSELVGEQFNVKNYGVWNNFKEIDFSLLPESFVLKSTHDSGGVVICRNKDSLDFSAASKKLEKCLKAKPYYLTREWPYKNIQPRIIAEELLKPADGEELLDYKFYCFHGKPTIMYVASSQEFGERIVGFYDMNFNELDIKKSTMSERVFNISKPSQFEKMKKLAKVLSQNLPFIRVDFYIVNNQVKVGEFTFYHDGGMGAFYPQEWDYKLGRCLDLSQLEQSE